MEKFLWGVATAATQIEGAYDTDGKGLSIWDVFSRIPSAIRNGDTPDEACDSYHRFKEDIALMKEIGVNAYRFSVSWSRILPEGRGKINRKGLDYYRRLTDELEEAEIAPNITLYHWDLPYELQRIGGWLNRDVADMFADYAEIVFKNIPNAKMFATHNEPIATYVGYALKAFAPGYGLEKYGRQANHNLLLSHGKAVERFRASKHKAKIGIVVDIWNRVPADKNSLRDVALAAEQNGLAHGSYLSPLFCGEYNRYVEEKMKREKIKIERKSDDLKIIGVPLDFYGLNCYNRIMVSACPDVDVRKVIAQNGGNFADNGNEMYPDAIYDALKIARDDYKVNIPIYITENGIGFENENTVNGKVMDLQRIEYLKNAFASLERAKKDGFDVRGYFLWSLLDNFEWNAGYSMKFGICTRDRKKKASADFYKEHIVKNQ
ncbi:glycoside hydrolase family 1 protein [Pumilibacter intestinalis]|uniref:glycoside hydrolase family 1 protein n=1 Tax=Pumilibacter intestinalis TaxID=2941511 RepID=UPI00203E51ED|nr:family 1 glycosylhydrolase [Pumilibacter intestinalis]